MKYILLTSICCLLFSTMHGCSEPTVELIPVSGIVKIDGEPANGIMVMFVPNTLDETVVAPTSQALSNDEGKFELYTLQNEKGAVPGAHRVSLIDTFEERVPQGEVATQPPRLATKFATGSISVNLKLGEEVVLDATGPKK